MNISIKLQIQKRKIEYKNNENNTKAKGEISMDFTGKNIIVTGGASGIGKAIVTGVVEGGGHAIIVDLNLDAAEKLREELGKYNFNGRRADIDSHFICSIVFMRLHLSHLRLHNSASLQWKFPSTSDIEFLYIFLPHQSFHPARGGLKCHPAWLKSWLHSFPDLCF